MLSRIYIVVISQSLGIHHHGEEDHHNEEVHYRDKNDPIWKMCVTIGVIFILWMMECFMGHDHDHDHENDNISTQSGNESSKKKKCAFLNPKSFKRSCLKNIKSISKFLKLETKFLLVILN